MIILDIVKMSFLNTLMLLYLGLPAHWSLDLHFYIHLRKGRKSNQVFEYTFHFGAAWVIMLCNYHLGNGYYTEPGGPLQWKASESILSLLGPPCYLWGTSPVVGAWKTRVKPAPSTREIPTPALVGTLLVGDSVDEQSNGSPT